MNNINTYNYKEDIVIKPDNPIYDQVVSMLIQQERNKSRLLPTIRGYENISIGDRVILRYNGGYEVPKRLDGKVAIVTGFTKTKVLVKCYGSKGEKKVKSIQLLKEVEDSDQRKN